MHSSFNSIVNSNYKYFQRFSVKIWFKFGLMVPPVFCLLTCVNDCWPRFNVNRGSSLFGAQSPHEMLSS